MPPPEPASTATQELNEFLLEFSITLNRHAVYPDSHPSLSGSAQSVIDRLDVLLRERSTVSIGVARRQLIIEGVATDENHPVLRSVAERLHRQHIGAITFSRGASVDELRAVLRLLTVEAEQEDTPLGLGDPARLKAWERIRLYALTYGDLELVEGEEGDGGGSGSGDTTASQLWLGLARAAIAQEDSESVTAATDSAAIAEAINEHEAAPAYDQVIVGYMLQLATQLREAGPDSAKSVRSRMSNLITRLDGRTLKRLVEMGGDIGQRERFVLDTADTLSTDAVLDVLKAAADSSEQTISNSMLRMLTKLSANAGPGMRGEASDGAVRDQVRELIQGWSLLDPNPDAYTQALENLARMPKGSGGSDTEYPAEPLRLVQMSLEIDVVGVPFWRAVQTLLMDGRLPEVITLLDNAPEGSGAAEALWERLTSHDMVRVLFTTDPVDFPTLDRLLQRLPEPGVASVLLDRISESESRTTRMGMFQRITARGTFIIPQIIARLTDHRWYVLRNMLAMLNEIGFYPAGFSALDYAKHEHPNVRREALQLATLSGEQREEAMCIAFSDDDERTVRVATRAARNDFPLETVPFALKVLEKEFSEELHLQVLRILRGIRTDEVLDTMLSLAVSRKTILGNPKLAPKSPEMLSALTTLAQTWSQHPRAIPVLARARASRDDEIMSAIGARAGK
jgi:hypothetical protein